MDGRGTRQGLRAGALGACLLVAAIAGAVFASADSGSGGCGYGGGGSAYCAPASSSYFQGRVIQAGTLSPLQYAVVTARDDSGHAYSTSSEKDGSFRLGPLPAGSYVLDFNRYGHDQQWYDGATNPGDASALTVLDNQTVEVFAQLAPTAETISGDVTEAATGLPVAGICIQMSLVPQVGDPIAPPDQVDGNCPGAITSPTGSYVLGGFPAGPYEYVLQASDPQGRFPTVYYQDTADILAATRVSAPATADIAVGPNDGDGVAEPPNVDGNNDGIPDSQQDYVTTLPTPIGQQVTIATPDSGYPLTAVTATDPPANNPPPPGADLPAGVLGFTVTLPPNQTTVDVDVVLPTGLTPQGYLKLLNGVWSDFTPNVTIQGNVVTLHLVDNLVGDADPTDGVIVDPGAPVVGYGFSGFRPPLDKGKTVKAGSTVPVKWHLTDRTGVPVSESASFVGLTFAPCGGGPATPVESPGGSGFENHGDGDFQVNWKVPQGLSGCQTLALQLADGLGGRTVDVQVR